MGQIGQGGVAPPALGDLFICDFPWAAPKDDMASMEHPLFSLATRPDRRILRYVHGAASIEVTPSVKGLATIHDKDVLIFCVSQLMAAINAGRPVAPTLHLKAYDLLAATQRETSGDGYRRLREAFERLSGTRIVTNIETGGIESTRGFGLIDGWEILRRLTRTDRERVHVVAISAAPISQKRIQEFQPLKWLQKPFPMDALVRAIGDGRAAVPEAAETTASGSAV